MLPSLRLGSKVRKQVLRLAGEIEHAECDSDLPVVWLVLSQSVFFCNLGYDTQRQSVLATFL